MARVLAVRVCVLVAIGAGGAVASPVGQSTELSAGPNAGSLPAGVAPGADGDLWFTDTSEAIGRITPSRTITEFCPGSSHNPAGIAPVADGNLWFNDRARLPAQRSERSSAHIQARPIRGKGRV